MWRYTFYVSAEKYIHVYTSECLNAGGCHVSAVHLFFFLQFTLAMIAFGQMVCAKERPKCAECPVGGTCPSKNKFAAVQKPDKSVFFHFCLVQ